jgi:hypothetical protein
MDSGAQLLYMGIRDAGQGIAQGINKYHEKKEKKKQEEAALTFAKKYGANFGLDTSDEEALKAGIRAYGPEKVFALGQMGQQLQEKQEASLKQKAQLAKLDMLSRYADGEGKGVLSKIAQEKRERMLQDPSVAAAVQMYRGTGQAPTEDGLAKFLSVRGEKPKPGSAGYKTQKVDGIGTIVQDVSTGEAVPSSAIQKDDTAGGFSNWDEAVGALKKAGGKGQIQQTSGGRWIIQAQVGEPVDQEKVGKKVPVDDDPDSYFTMSPDGSWRLVRKNQNNFFLGGGVVPPVK